MMSVVAAASAAAAAVGPAPVSPSPVPYVMCGGGARKRKDVVHEEVAEDGRREVVVDAPRRQHGRPGLFVLETVEEDREELSSIGAVSDEEVVEDGEEVESKETWKRKKKGGLTCLGALDEALPIKRGLSSFFSGKSRSFADLQEVAGTSANVDILAKPENPFNKRRRILRGCSIRRVSSTSLTALPPFLPPEPSVSIGNGGGVVNGGSSG